MFVDRVALEDFRNYEREEVQFADGLNVVVGANAQGKTNLLEAVYCLGGLGPLRSSESEVVRHGAERAIVHAVMNRRSRNIRVDMEMKQGRSARVLVNRTPVSGPRALRELATCVFFGPDDLSLVKGSPDVRRRFLDDLVVKLRPAREPIRREWERVLRQRNALLKTIPRSSAGRSDALSTLDVWDEAMGRAGAELTAARIETLEDLGPVVNERYAGIAGTGSIAMSYSSAWLDPGAVTNDVNALRAILEQQIAATRGREIERGMSLVGPQRDDVAIHIARDASVVDARAYASQGDQRTIALALKLGERDLLADALGDPPILLLDDVFSELDPSRREWLAKEVKGLGQTVVSSAGDSHDVPGGHDRLFTVVAGKVAQG
ncbi:MAG: DNA replication/repair protein RecF [Actinomycetota bacterium]|nr:DNA replication/repair protein RecF [Actinomycetota bacterium]